MASQHILATGRISKWGSSIRIAPHTDQAAAELGTILTQGMDDEQWREQVEHEISILDSHEDAAQFYDAGLQLDLDAATADLIDGREDEQFWARGAW